MDDDFDNAAPKRRFRLMHCTMVMLGLLFVGKMADVASGVHALNMVRDARAAEEAKPAAEAKDEGEKKDAKKEKKKEAAPPEEMTAGAGKLTVKQVEALKEKDVASPYTPTELDLLQNLTKRREELDTREKELALKSKVLEATEKRINDKVLEMKTLQAELARVVEQYNTRQNSEIMSLVKIYENMKPGDAAAIFNEMDMPILLSVIDKMSERKVAPVLAGMDPRRARDVTQELAELRRRRSTVSTN